MFSFFFPFAVLWIMALPSVGDWKSNISLILQQTEKNLEGRRPHIYSRPRSPVHYPPEAFGMPRHFRDSPISKNITEDSKTKEIHDLTQDINVIRKEIQQSAKKTELLLAEVEKLHREMNLVKKRLELQEVSKKGSEALSWDSATTDEKVANLFGLKDELFHTEALIRQHLMRETPNNQSEDEFDLFDKERRSEY